MRWSLISIMESKLKNFCKFCYIHIPFCDKKCAYCSFVTYEKKDGKEEYVKYLIKELNLYEKGSLETLYFGGGTPSVLDPSLIDKIIKEFELQKEAEITLEFNPEKSYYENLKKYKEIGINRLSIGCQTFNDNLLKRVGRIHTANEAIGAFNRAKEENFENINLDLMFALPNQTLAELKEDLNILKKLSPEHISIYSLIWKEGTKFALLKEKGIIKETPEELEAEMYDYIISFLEDNGYLHYEISSFCKKGFESKHNKAYWHNENYFGFGLGAAGYLKNTRYTNVTNFKKYYEMLEQNLLPRKEEEIITNKKKLEYQLILSLRMLKEGFNLKDLKKNFEIENFYINKLKELVKKELLFIENNNYKLTKKGLFFSNEVFSELLDI